MCPTGHHLIVTGVGGGQGKLPMNTRPEESVRVSSCRSWGLRNVPDQGEQNMMHYNGNQVDNVKE